MAKGARKVVGLGANGTVEVERGDGARMTVALAGLPDDLKKQADALKKEGDASPMAGRIDTEGAPARAENVQVAAAKPAKPAAFSPFTPGAVDTEVARGPDPAAAFQERFNTRQRTDEAPADATPVDQGASFVDPGAAPAPLTQGPGVTYATRTTRQESGVTPQSEADILKAHAASEDAARAAGAATEARVEQDAQTELRRQEVEAGAAAHKEETQRRHMAAIAAKDQEREAAEADFASTTIDPDHYYAKQSTGSKILAAIGLLVSGAGSGITGQPNMAMQVINNAIDRDIDAQKANLDKKRVRVEMLNGALGRMRQAMGDDLDAEEAARIAHLGIVNRDLAAAMANAKSPEVQARLAEGQAQLQAQIAEKKTALVASLARKEEIQKVTAPVGGGGAGATAGRPDAGIPGFVVTDPQAVAGLDNVEQRQLRTAVSAAQMLRQASAKMVEIRTQSGTELTPSQAKSEFEIHRGTMIGAMNQLREAGVVNDNEYKRLSEEIPSLGLKMSDAARAVGYDPTLEKLKGIERGLMAQVDAKLGAFGGRLSGGAGAGARTQLGEVP